jgi:hypothetical protein
VVVVLLLLLLLVVMVVMVEGADGRIKGFRIPPGCAVLCQGPLAMPVDLLFPSSSPQVGMECSFMYVHTSLLSRPPSLSPSRAIHGRDCPAAMCC